MPTPISLTELAKVKENNLKLIHSYKISRMSLYDYGQNCGVVPLLLYGLFCLATAGVLHFLLFILLDPSSFKDCEHTKKKKDAAEVAFKELDGINLSQDTNPDRLAIQELKDSLKKPITKLFTAVRNCHYQYHKALPTEVTVTDLTNKPRGFFAEILHWWRTSLLERIVEQCQRNLLALDHPPPYTPKPTN